MTYYTYIHSAPNGKVFYIGKGKNDRAFSFGDRSDDWRRAVKAHKGLSIEILAEWDTEEEAFEHEKFLIECFDAMNVGLVNKTKGGRGPYGLKQSEEANESRRQKNTGYVHKIVTCPNCNKSGGETSMKRWHFEKCRGTLEFRARVTWNDQRIHLGYFNTQEEANNAQTLALQKFKEKT